MLCYLTIWVISRVQTPLAYMLKSLSGCHLSTQRGFSGRGNCLRPELCCSTQRHLSSGCENWILQSSVLSLSVQSGQRWWGRGRGCPPKKRATGRGGCWMLLERHDVKTRPSFGFCYVLGKRVYSFIGNKHQERKPYFLHWFLFFLWKAQTKPEYG